MTQTGDLLISLLMAALLKSGGTFPTYQQPDWHFTGPNVAKGRVASQSSLFENRTAEEAVDGDTSTDIQDFSCSHTNNEKNSWWKVDLDKYYVIKGIRIYNRREEKDRLKNFRIVGHRQNPVQRWNEIYNDATKPSYKQIYKHETINLTFNNNDAYNQIEIVIPGPYLTLCEVQIYAVAHCETPQAILNGDYSAALRYQYRERDTVLWKCNTNFWPNTYTARTCTQTSTWSGPNPSCKQINCYHPGSLAHGNYTLLNGQIYDYGTVINGTSVRVLCDNGYSPEKTYIHCSSSGGIGKWDSSGSCSQVTCNPLKTSGGVYNYKPNYFARGSQYPFGTSANLTCLKDFVLSGTNTVLTCGNAGRWQPPTGKRSLCVPTCNTSTATHGWYIDKRGQRPSTFVAGQAAYLQCETGYVVDPSGDRESTKIACLKYHKWTFNHAKCKIITCQLDMLQHERNFYKFESGYGSSIDYNTDLKTSCMIGHQRASGDFTRTCQANGTLSGQEMQCSSVVCPLTSLQAEKNFYKLDKSYSPEITYDMEIIASCNPGYERYSGNYSRKCLAKGSFDGTELLCSKLPDKEGQTSVPMAAIGGGVGGAVIAIIVVVAVALIFVMRRRRLSSAKRPGSHNRYADQKSPNSGDTNMYSEVTDTGIEMAEARRGPSSDGVYYNEVEQDNAYYCFTNPMKVPERGIKIEELSDFVLSANEDHEKYVKEFKSFEDGMAKPHKAALQNRSKNRYRNLYAYDDTRVVLEVWNPKTETDYINANYIHGFGKFKEYIASQGVTKENLDDFWRMIWQTDSGKIVMLTNVWEEQKVKCIEYWPEKGTKSFGSVTVTLQDTDTYSNFVIRTLMLKKDDEPPRRVLQFHFTAWPDRGVPKYSSALVHFRSKVKNTPTACKGPTVVHCSAGIGRTGTYIALDYLTDQGRELGMVDVAGCVEMLRRQRVNMVQTKDQYVFIHQALVETLMLSTSALPAEKFPNTYSDLLTIDPVKRKRKLDLEFEAIGSMAPAPEEAQYSTAKKVRHRDKNRYSNILPIEAYMPRINGPGQSQKECYINAAILPSYKTANAMIITQSPLETTREDFWKMVVNHNSHTIVMMNTVAELKESEIYWPNVGQTVTFGAIEVTGNHTEESNGHAVLTLNVKANNKERDIRLIQFGHWGPDRQVPDGTGQLLTAIELVQHWQRRTGNHTLVVHCMDGTEKSGLFCVVYALLARTVVEHDVAISQIIQEMRNRRERVIPNVVSILKTRSKAQFQFCHEVVLEFLKQFDTYSNFTSI